MRKQYRRKMGEECHYKEISSRCMLKIIQCGHTLAKSTVTTRPSIILVSLAYIF